MHLKKLKNIINGINGVKILNNSEIEIFVADANEPGIADETLTEKAKMLVEMAGIKWGGFVTGYGSWILRESYSPKGEFCDTSSVHHY